MFLRSPMALSSLDRITMSYHASVIWTNLSLRGDSSGVNGAGVPSAVGNKTRRMREAFGITVLFRGCFQWCQI